MENNEANNQETNNEEPKTTLSAGTKVIAPIHDDIVPESPIHGAAKTDAEDTTDSESEAVSEEPVPTEDKETPAVINEALATLPEPTKPSAEPVVAPIVTTPPVQQVYEEPEVRHGIVKRWFGETKAYLAEYAVQLVLLTTLLGLASIFFGAIIDPASEASKWFSSWQYQASIGQLAAVVALVPLLVVIARRTAGTEADAPLVRESNWRKAFLGIFLIVLGLTAVGYTVQFVYVLLSMALNAGLAVDTVENPGITLAKAGFSAVLFGVSALLYAKDYRRSSSRATVLQTVHRYGLIVFTVILAVVFAAIPLQRQRGAYVDSLKVGDLSSIQSAVTTYSTKNRKLPERLDDLDLSKEVKTRSASLGYQYKKGTGSEYELCADFATDASKKESDTTATRLTDFGSLSSSGANYEDMYSTASTQESPRNHKQGNQCFKYTARGVRTSTSSSSRLPSSSTRSTTNMNTQRPATSYDDADYSDTSSFDSFDF